MGNKDTLNPSLYSLRGFPSRASELGGTGEVDDEYYKRQFGRLDSPAGGTGDELLREEISARLAQDPSIDSSNLEIEVSHGQVVFSGSVPDKQMKFRAEDLAENIFGVGKVINNIRVMRKTLRPPTRSP